MPVEDKLEEGKIKLFARLSSGVISETQCTFHVSFKKGDGFTTEFDTKTIEGDLVNREAKTELQLPKVPDDSDSYKCTWYLMHEQRRYDGETSWLVWPRSIEIAAKTKDGSQPFKGAPFKLTQPKIAEKTAESPDDGVTVINGLMAASFSVEVMPPYQGNWTITRGRKREVRVEKTPLAAEFVTPAKGTHKQYVNCQGSGGDFHQSILKVSIGPKGGACLDGDKIYVKVTFGRESKRNDPRPILKDVDNLAGPTLDGQKEIYTGDVTLDDTGAAREIKLQLGLAGGDTCKVEISGASNAATASIFPADETLVITNWRKIYYQVTRPANLAQPDLTRITASLEEVFIEYEPSPERTLDVGSGPKGSWHPAADLGLAGSDCLIIGDHNKDYFHKEFNEAKMPRSVHTLLCHAQLDGGTKGSNQAFVKMVVKPGDLFNFPGVGMVPGFYIVGAQHNVAILPRSVHGERQAVTQARWESAADATQKGDIPDDHIFIDFANYKPWSGALAMRLPANAVTALTAGNVLVSFWFAFVRGPYLGESNPRARHQQLINAAIAADTQNDIMAHELGHSLGMVADPSHPIPGIADTIAEHDWQYTANGHSGPHCGYGASKPFAPNMNTQIASCKCIMFGGNVEAGSVSDGHFCVRCKPLLLGQDCVKLHS